LVTARRYGIIVYWFEIETSKLIRVRAPKEFGTVHSSEEPVGKILLNPYW
jgi:hypothetical protein